MSEISPNSTQIKSSYKTLAASLADKFTQNSSKIIESTQDHQLLSLKSAENEHFFLERHIDPNTNLQSNLKLVIEDNNASFDSNTIEYQVNNDGTINKQTINHKSKSEDLPAYIDSQANYNSQLGYSNSQTNFIDSQMEFNKKDDSQMHSKQKTDQAPPQPITGQEADQLTNLVSQSSVVE